MMADQSQVVVVKGKIVSRPWEGSWYQRNLRSTSGIPLPKAAISRQLLIQRCKIVQLGVILKTT